MKIKWTILGCLLLIQSSIAFAGFTTGTFKYKGAWRKYAIYVPAIYASSSEKVPLLLGLHGYGDDIDNFRNICMTNIADTANYICVYAEALPWLGANAWNSGAGVGIINVNSEVDDVGFLNSLIDTVISKYRIDTTRMYAFGFSFGGFMVDRLATECSQRFAAACNVSGLHGNFLAGKIPSTYVPYLKFHGTNDPTISYNGMQTVGLFPGFGLSAENTVKFWMTQNHCDTIPVVDSMPNTANDGLRFIRFTYNNGDNNSKVIFYKVLNGLHKWYGLPANDISYCQTIWDFFRQYKRENFVTAIRNINHVEQIKIFPNPSNGNFTVSLQNLNYNIQQISIFDIAGKEVYTQVVTTQSPITIISNLPKGLYLLRLVDNEKHAMTEKIIIE